MSEIVEKQEEFSAAYTRHFFSEKFILIELSHIAVIALASDPIIIAGFIRR